MYELIVESEFSAAHRLREYRGACEKLHGHNYRVEMVVASEKLDALGMVADFRELKRVLQEAVERYDHGFLNELAEFREQNPTAENVARVLFEECSRRLARGVRARSITVWESPRCGARYSAPADDSASPRRARRARRKEK
ncbi:MAG: 6-carboxytetrahydropterin synthase QueD [Candidatus Brocadiia bacterium]